MAKENQENLSPEEQLSNCLLSQYMLCAGGVLGGAAYGIKTKKGVLPMVVAGVAGTMADMAYGYVIACKKEVELVEKSKRTEMDKLLKHKYFGNFWTVAMVDGSRKKWISTLQLLFQAAIFTKKCNFTLYQGLNGIKHDSDGR